MFLPAHCVARSREAVSSLANRRADTIIFSEACANFPWVSHATWLLSQMIRWGHVRAPFNIAEVAQRVYRPDIFRKAVADFGFAMPDRDTKAEGNGRFFGSEIFDPAESDCLHR